MMTSGCNCPSSEGATLATSESCRRMLNKMLRELPKEAGKTESPRTRTSRVPWSTSQPFAALASANPSLSGKLTITSLLEAMRGVAVRCEDGDFVADCLQSHRRVDNESLGSSNSQVRMDKDDASRCGSLGCHCPKDWCSCKLSPAASEFRDEAH